jgi:hypothetical protein
VAGDEEAAVRALHHLRDPREDLLALRLELRRAGVEEDLVGELDDQAPAAQEDVEVVDAQRLAELLGEVLVGGEALVGEGLRGELLRERALTPVEAGLAAGELGVEKAAPNTPAGRGRNGGSSPK